MNNKMACDLETGVCGVGGEEEMTLIDFNEPQEKITLYYVTDPICSHCWALEPVLLRFTEQYGHYIRFQTVMGGLLKDWEGFADVKNGISKPSDVAGHWREVGVHSRMPIDGSVWIDNPIQSSYPPSRVFKVIQKIDENAANVFLRRAREAVFAFDQNIGDNSVLVAIVDQMGLNGEEIVKEAGQPASQELLDQDFALASKLGARGFPTIVMINEQNKGVKIVGTRSLDSYVEGLKQVLSSTDELQVKPQPALAKLLEKEVRLFAKEIEVMYDLEPSQLNSFIAKELSPGAYAQKEILGEAYVERVSQS